MDGVGRLFVAAVARNRGVSEAVVTADFGEGTAILATAAVEVGMIDAVRSSAAPPPRPAAQPEQQGAAIPAVPATPATGRMEGMMSESRTNGREPEQKPVPEDRRGADGGPPDVVALVAELDVQRTAVADAAAKLEAMAAELATERAGREMAEGAVAELSASVATLMEERRVAARDESIGRAYERGAITKADADKYRADYDAAPDVVAGILARLPDNAAWPASGQGARASSEGDTGASGLTTRGGFAAAVRELAAAKKITFGEAYDELAALEPDALREATGESGKAAGGVR